MPQPSKTPPIHAPARVRVASPKVNHPLQSLDSKCKAVSQDYARKFKGDVLRWRIEDQDLVILFIDGRKYRFLMPPGWLK